MKQILTDFTDFLEISRLLNFKFFPNSVIVIVIAMVKSVGENAN